MRIESKTAWRLAILAVGGALVGLAPVGAAPAYASHGTTTRVSLGSRGQQGDYGSVSPSLSADGLKTAFMSAADNLVPYDGNGFYPDIFVNDRGVGSTIFGETTLVSRDSEGRQCPCVSDFPAIGADGGFVAFVSLDVGGRSLVPEDTNHDYDIFARDLASGRTEMVSVSSDEEPANASSASTPSISADGRYVDFTSYATNLVADDTNRQPDVFVRDRLAGTTERVNVGSEGEQANGHSDFYGKSTISADGRYVVFRSWASNLVPDDPNGSIGSIFVRDRWAGTTEIVDPSLEGPPGSDAAISADGRHVMFTSMASDLVPDDTNEIGDAFVRDLDTGQIERVSVSSKGRQGERGNGCYSDCEGALYPAISADGRFVAFHSEFANLVPNDTNRAEDVFWRDRVGGQTARVSVSSTGEQGNQERHGESWFGTAIGASGRSVAFDSSASNLVPNDTNLNFDVFVHEMRAPAPRAGTRLSPQGVTTTRHPLDIGGNKRTERQGG